MGLKRLQRSSQTKTKRVVLVIGPKSKLPSTISTSDPRIEILQSKYVQKELADKLLLAKLGEYKATFPSDELVIISRDKGFESNRMLNKSLARLQN